MSTGTKKTVGVSGTSSMLHGADQAGGDEVIFSSDSGLLDPSSGGVWSPPVAMKPPPLPSSIQAGMNLNETDDDAMIVTSNNLEAHQAFEVFAGKWYGPRSYPAAAATGGGLAGTSRETPLQRLARLQAELDLLQNDLAVEDSIASTMNDQDPTYANQQQDMLTTAKQQLHKLNSHVSDMQRHAERQAALSSIMTASFSNLQQPQATVSSTSSGIQPMTTLPSSLEERLQRLEAMVGTSSSNRNKTQSFNQRLVVLEQFQGKLDADQVDLWQKRAKVIRQDLEAAAKARNKLHSVATGSSSGAGGGGSSSSSSKEDSKKIAELYDTLQQTQGLQGHLPLLVQRLQQAAQLHTDASVWAARLRACEDVAIRLQTAVGVLEESVETLTQTTLPQTAQSMIQNMHRLDERIKAIQKE